MIHTKDVWSGTDLKLLVKLRCKGFNMNDDDFNVELRWTDDETHSRVYYKDDSAWVRDEKLNWYLKLPTKELLGETDMVATLFVPDSDFETGFRKQVVKRYLFDIRKP